MTDAPMPEPPREREIEVMGRIAHEFLRVARGVFWVGGVAALVYGFDLFLATVEEHSAPSALGTVWFSLGLPLVLPTCWMLTRKRACIGMALFYAAIWFVPIALPDDSSYGFILRMFTTVVSLSTLLVWSTLWKLTNPNRQQPT